MPSGVFIYTTVGIHRLLASTWIDGGWVDGWMNEWIHEESPLFKHSSRMVRRPFPHFPISYFLFPVSLSACSALFCSVPFNSLLPHLPAPISLPRPFVRPYPSIPVPFYFAPISSRLVTSRHVTSRPSSLSPSSFFYFEKRREKERNSD